MASPRRWNLCFQETCLRGGVWGGLSQFGRQVAVDIQRLTNVPKVQIQNSRALENQSISERFRTNHSKKDLVEAFVDPVIPVLAVHRDQRLRSPNLPSFVPLREFKTSQQRNIGNIPRNQLVSYCI